VLDYRMKVRSREDTAWVESGFRVITSPALVTRNKKKRPRMGTWRIVPVPVQGVAPSAALLAKASTFLYFSGPATGLVRRGMEMTLGGRSCRLWQVPMPTGVPAYIYLAEVAPNLLALSYLSASLDEEDLASLEIHLVKVELGPRSVPAEEGNSLLRTLWRWDVPKSRVPGQRTGVESEQVE
jgi:hypothetical protein